MMRYKGFFHCFWTILILICLSIPMEVVGNDLFLKMNIQPIKDKKKAPNFYLIGLDGKKVDLKNLKGKVVFLNFWATWCGPCKEEMPSIEALYQQYKEKEFLFLTISVDYEGLKPVKEFIEKHHYTFPVLLDPKCETLDLYDVKGIPTTFIIDKKGIMIGKAIGPKNWKSPEVSSIINLLLKK